MSRNSAELGGRDEADEDPLRRAERDGVGEAKSSVASSSVLFTGVPQAEQKRTLSVIAVPQDVQVGIIFRKQFTAFQGRPFLQITLRGEPGGTDREIVLTVEAVQGKMFSAI